MIERRNVMMEEKARVGTIKQNSVGEIIVGAGMLVGCATSQRVPPPPPPTPGGETGRSIRAKLAEGPEGVERGHNSSIQTTHKKL